MRTRRYRCMSYVYARSNGLFEIRYPIPVYVVNYFPKPSGKGFRTHIIKSLGTRDKSVATSTAIAEVSAFESMFSVLREGVASDEFRAFCRVAYEQESALVLKRRLDSETSQQPYLEKELSSLREILRQGDLDELEAVVGWFVDFYFESTANSSAVVPTDTPMRNALLTAAAGVLADAYTQANASTRGVSKLPNQTHRSQSRLCAIDRMLLVQSRNTGTSCLHHRSCQHAPKPEVCVVSRADLCSLKTPFFPIGENKEGVSLNCTYLQSFDQV